MLYSSSGAPIVLLRRFQPVFEASGTATSGILMPEFRCRRRSTCGTSVGYAAPIFGGSTEKSSR